MLLVWLAACTGKDEGSSTAPPLSLDDTGEECGGTAPTVEALVVKNGGLITVKGETQPSIEVDVTFADMDADVDVAEIRYWWDASVDGTVDTTGPEDYSTGAFQVDSDSEPCHGASGELDQRFGVNGTNFAFSTPYEFAVTVTDAHGLTSAVAIEDGVTPKEDGSDGE
jgi:hypothetical protein